MIILESTMRSPNVKNAGGVGDLNSLREAEIRLDNFYLIHQVKENPHFEARMKFSRNYFRAMELAANDMKCREISELLRIKEGTVKHWLRGHVPYLIKLASQIPPEEPAPNYKWLPLFINNRWRYVDFIQVPAKVRDYGDILNVLEQLKKVESDEMRELGKKFGYIDKEFAFGYIIGLMISDSDKDSCKTISTRLRLGLSRKTILNLNIGEAFCYCLDMLGISAKRFKDGKTSRKLPNGRFIWKSQYSPLISWLKEVCLGLNQKETTTYTPIKCDWVLKAPVNFRTAVLNGIYDGDGCAYIRGWQISNACGPNQIFLQKLLGTFGIRSNIRGPKVLIETKEGLGKACQLCVFKFALDKVDKTKTLVRMLENSKYIHRRDDYDLIMRRVVRLHKVGYEPKDIPLKVFDEFRIGIHPRRIYTILKWGDSYGKKNKSSVPRGCGKGFSQLQHSLQE
jgi:hypothetical protein